MNGLMVEFYHIINNWIFVYAIILMGLYLFLAGSSLLEIRTYMNRNKYMYYDDKYKNIHSQNLLLLP